MSPNLNAGPLEELARRLSSRTGLALSRDEPLAPRTTLRIGGAAEIFARVSMEGALADLLDRTQELEIPVRVLGLGSNVLLPDEGLSGVTAVLDGEFLEMSFDDGSVDAGAGLALAKVARASVEQGLSGLEALAGFPSTVGGAVVMNAGCFGVEIKDVLICTTVVRPGGNRQTMRVEELAAAYRRTNLQGTDAVVTRARFRLRPDGDGTALDRLTELNRKRRDSMPSGSPNAGSIFRNPPGDFAGRLVEACGLKGRQEGGARISEVHANVIVNTGGASADDVLRLMKTAYLEVRSRFQVQLEPELILGGSLRSRWNRGLEES